MRGAPPKGGRYKTGVENLRQWRDDKGRRKWEWDAGKWLARKEMRPGCIFVCLNGAERVESGLEATGAVKHDWGKKCCLNGRAYDDWQLSLVQREHSTSLAPW